MIKGIINSREKVSKGEKIMPRDARLRVRPEVRRWLIRVGGAFAVAVLVLAGSITTSLALEKLTVLQGMAACFKWCDENNKTENSRDACKHQCNKYWWCNGSDAKSSQTAVAMCGFYGTKVTRNPQTTPQSPATTKPQGTVTTR